MEFKTFDQYNPDESITALWYGGFGSGKTEAAGSAGEKTLYIDVGKSATTFHAPGYKARKGPFKGIYIPISDTPSSNSSLVPNATGFDAVCDAIDEALAKIPDKFETIVVDEATRLRAFAMNKGIRISAATEKSKTFAAAEKHGAILPVVQDYGAEMSLVEQFCNGYTDICKRYGKHFILIAHERHIYNKPSKIGEQPSLQRILPGFTGQTFPDSIANIFDLVWHFECVNQDKFYARTVGTANSAEVAIQETGVAAKTRFSGIFNEKEYNVSWPNVLKRIREQVPVKR